MKTNNSVCRGYFFTVEFIFLQFCDGVIFFNICSVGISLKLFDNFYLSVDRSAQVCFYFIVLHEKQVKFLYCCLCFKQIWNDDGDHHAEAPYRTYDNIIDPVSGFVSAGGDVDRNTGHTRIRSLVQLNRTPQSAAPCDQHSIRTREQAAPPDLKRDNTLAPGGPTAWNSRSTSDSWIKSQLGGVFFLWVFFYTFVF